MRAYAAILIDSFRESLHSRVLWVVLICITLMFLVLFPLRLQEHATTGLREHDVSNWPDLASKLLRAGADEKSATTSEKQTPRPELLVWDRLDQNARENLPILVQPQLDAVTKKSRGFGDLMALDQAKKVIVRALREQINASDWLTDQELKRLALRREGRQILQRVEAGKNLSIDESLRLHRLALEAIFPESIDASPPQSYSVAYAYFDSDQPLPFTRKQLVDMLPAVVVYLMDWLFGVFGILVALLVTASIVPQMFEPGSLHLLLSKPISRSLLYLTKFLGGCIFALLSGAYFAGGLWLILGLRFEVWDIRLLAAVPVYGFVFAVYYSVTALAGVVFRNTIVSVVLGVLFWLVCFGTGSTHRVMTALVVDAQRVEHITIAGDTILVSQPTGVHVWNADEREYQRAYRSVEEGPEPFNQTQPEFGPFYDQQHDQLISLERSQFRGSETVLSVAAHTDRWARHHGVQLPSSTTNVLLDTQGRVIAVTLQGIYRSMKDVATADGGPKVLGFQLPFGSASSFELTSRGKWPYPAQVITAAIDSHDNLAIYSRGHLGIWRANEKGEYSESAIHDFRDDDFSNAEQSDLLVTLGDSRVLLADGDGRLRVLDAEKLELITEHLPDEKQRPRQVLAAPDGEHFSILYTGGTLWSYDSATDTFNRAAVVGQGTISAVAYDPAGDLWLAHHATQISRVERTSGRTELVCNPQRNTAQYAYHYVVHPLYVVLPKPGELYHTLLYLLTGKETELAAPRGPASANRDYNERLSPWQPVWSSGIFLMAMLAIGCVYIEWMEF